MRRILAVIALGMSLVGCVYSGPGPGYYGYGPGYHYHYYP